MDAMNPIYENSLDGGAWMLRVWDDIEGSEGYSAHLRVYDRDETCVHEEVVPVSYAARFGPDVADVDAWQERTLTVVDHPEQRVAP